MQWNLEGSVSVFEEETYVTGRTLILKKATTLVFIFKQGSKELAWQVTIAVCSVEIFPKMGSGFVRNM